MATNQQTQANRANAQQSTGPRTAAGKARSSQNALKHGLRAQATVLPDENTADFDFLVSELENQFQPQTPIEWTLLRQLADAEWRMRRVPSLEAGLFAALFKDSRRHYEYFPEQLPDDEDEANLLLIGSATKSATGKTDPLSKLSRYESRLAHRYFKALEQLQKIQKARTRETKNRPTAPTPAPQPPAIPPRREGNPKQSPLARETPRQQQPPTLQPVANQQHTNAPKTKTSKPTEPRQTNPIPKPPAIPPFRKEAGTSTCGVNVHVCRLPNPREVAGGAAVPRHRSPVFRSAGPRFRQFTTRIVRPTSERSCAKAIRPDDSGRGKPGASRDTRQARLLQLRCPGLVSGHARPALI
jgi:hypothetical protein